VLDHENGVTGLHEAIQHFKQFVDVGEMQPGRWFVSPITHRNEEMQEEMSIIRARDVVIRARTQCVNTARGIAKTLGIRLTKCSTSSFARKALAQLPEHLAATFLPLCTTIRALTEQIRSYDSKIDELAKKYTQTELLRKVAGVGALTSVAYVCSG
jgi:transposase